VTFAERLKQFRLSAGLSQTDLGKLAGVSRNAVSQWEAGTTEPSTRRLQAIAMALRVPVDHLIATAPDYEDRSVEAATRLFDRLCYDQTTVDVVCAAADVSRHEFDALFADKDELLYAVLRAYNDRTFNDLRRIPAHYGTALDRLKYLLHLYYVHDLNRLRLTAALHAYSWRWNEVRERANQRQFSEHHEAVVAILDEAAAAGELRHGNFRAASELIFAAYTYCLRRALFAAYDADRLIAHLEPQLMLILKGLGYGAAKSGPDSGA